MNAESGPSAATMLLVCVTCKSEASLMGLGPQVALEGGEGFGQPRGQAVSGEGFG